VITVSILSFLIESKKIMSNASGSHYLLISGLSKNNKDSEEKNPEELKYGLL
jgi:hypothetical protein